jgi:hypothetical protein
MKFSILIISMLISCISHAEVSVDTLYRDKNVAHENLKQCSSSQESEMCQALKEYEGFFGADNFLIIYMCFREVSIKGLRHTESFWSDNTKLCVLVRKSVGH